MTEDQLKVYFFAYSEEKEQIAQLHAHLVQRGAKIQTLSDDKYSNILEIIKGSHLLAKTGGEELEEIFNSILSVVIGFQLEDAFKLIKEMSQIVLSDDFVGNGWQSNAGYATIVFSNLFHFYETDPKMKFFIFKILLELAGRAKVTESIDIKPSTIEAYFKEWNLSVDQQIELLRVIHNALISDNRGRDAAEVMIRLLKSYSDVDASKVELDACECVRTAIIDPQIYSFDHLLRIKPIQQLEKTKQPLFQLLKIFNSGTIVDFQNFVKGNPNFIKNELKYEEASLLKKIKILTLITLAEENKHLGYELLEKELCIADDNELENFLIDVLKSKAITGKLNGVNRVLNITATEQRSFDKEEWKKLRTKLDHLLKNLLKVKDDLNNASEKANELLQC